MPGVAQPYGHTWSHVDHQKDCPLRQRQRPALRRSQTHLQNRPTGLDLKKHNNRKHINNQNQNDPKWLCWGTEHIGTDSKWHRCQHKLLFLQFKARSTVSRPGLWALRELHGWHPVTQDVWVVDRWMPEVLGFEFWRDFMIFYVVSWFSWMLH